ncbi:MAG: M23 family metallopeptidase, partial [Deferrisomatales bacterium]
LDQTLVTPGRTVARGETIGLLGSTGKRTTGPHLHYSVRSDGKYVNPKNYILDSDRLPSLTARR